MLAGTMAVADVIKKLRESQGLTQYELSVRAGLTLGTLTSLEQGTNTDPRLSTLVRLARALHVTIDELAAENLAGPAPKKRAPKRRPKQ
jgi:transcriptional regulator with XRE-family HTH domain